MPAQDESQPRFPWAWFAALVVTAAATGLGFGISPKLGIGLACLTVVVYGSFVVWAMREGRRRRAAGRTADVANLQRRTRKHAKLLTVLAVLTVLTSTAAIATNDGDIPVWVLVLPPVLITVGAGLQWLLVWVILPRLAKKQASGSE